MHNRGFTLLEIVLAIGLSGAVIALLTTAIDQYLVRVDASRSQVETAQLARTLLNQIADDLRAVRFAMPDSESSGESDDGDTTTDASGALGIFGMTSDLRIDRSAIVQWEQLSRERDVETADAQLIVSARPEEMPQTVRYVLGDGKELLSAEFAEQGVSEEPITDGYAGLYRQQLPTGVWIDQEMSIGTAATNSNLAPLELIAPEVVSIEFAYFDGEQLLTEWDSSLAEALPTAIEIRLTMLKEPLFRDEKSPISQLNELRRKAENLVEFRRFVLLTRNAPPAEAEFPQQAQPPEDGQL